MRKSPRLIMAIIVALIGAVTYYSQRSTNEVTGEVQHISMSPAQEVALGLQAQPEMSQQFGGELGHPVIDEYVERVGQKVVSGSAAKDSPYTFDFHVLKDPETINAFALPGGQVSITLGLLRRLENEAALAGVLGHEVGHVIGRHSAEQMSKQQFASVLAGAAGVATSDPNDPRSGVRNAAIAAAAAQMITMKFGRDDELESDALGVRFIKSAGYDPAGMADLMTVLAQAGGARSQSEFFSTHPNPDNRLERIRQLVQEVGPGGEDGRARFQENVLRYVRQ